LSLFAKSRTDPLVSWKKISVTKNKQVKEKTKDSTALSLFAKSITDPLVSWKKISVTKNKQVKEKTKDSTL
jgi:hypothetical protein